MKKLFLFFFIFFLFNLNEVYSDDKLFKILKKGNKIIFIRHAYAPGNGDPKNFNLNNCSSQRNLSKIGIEQSKKIGSLFKKNNIEIDIVLSSEWCRCKDTARYAFKDYETFPALNSFYDERFAKNKDKQILELKEYIKNWNSDKNLVLVTHFVVIFEILNLGVKSGEIVVVDKNLNIIKGMEINN